MKDKDIKKLQRIMPFLTGGSTKITGTKQVNGFTIYTLSNGKKVKKKK